MKLRRPWIVTTKINGSFWRATSDTHYEEKTKQEVLAYERGGYLVRIVREPFERVSDSSYHAMDVR